MATGSRLPSGRPTRAYCCRFHPVDAAAKEARMLLDLGRRYAIEVVFDPLGEIGDATEGGFEIVGDNIYK